MSTLFLVCTNDEWYEIDKNGRISNVSANLPIFTKLFQSKMEVREIYCQGGLKQIEQAFKHPQLLERGTIIAKCKDKFRSLNIERAWVL